jgi:hypothetical protein
MRRTTGWAATTQLWQCWSRRQVANKLLANRQHYSYNWSTAIVL